MPFSHALSAAALAAALLGVPLPGQADHHPGSHLALALASGRDAPGRMLATAELTCDPDGGTHPDPARACAALREAHGDLSAVPPEKATMCPMLFAPVTAEARGEWAGRPVRFRHTFENRCTAEVGSGGVFRF